MGCWKLPGGIVALVSYPAPAAEPVILVADKTGSLCAVLLKDMAVAEDPVAPLCSHAVSERVVAGTCTAMTATGSLAYVASRDGMLVCLRLER